MKRLHWLEKVVICFTILFSVLTIISAFNIKDSTICIGPIQINANSLMLIWMGILWVFFTVLLLFITTRLSDIDERVNIRLTDEIGKTLSDIINSINDYLRHPANLECQEKIAEASKRLNGLKYKLSQGTLEEETSADMIKVLKQPVKIIERFYACSTFPIEWWFQPEWIFFLLNHLLICKSKNIKVVRFSIYMAKPDIKRHKREYLNFMDSHKNAGADLFTLKHEKVYAQIESLTRNLKLPNKETDGLRAFVKEYIDHSQKFSSNKQGIFPDGWIVKYKTGKIDCYIRDAITGKARPAKNSTERKAFENYFALLNLANEEPSNRLEREDIGAL